MLSLAHKSAPQMTSRSVQLLLRTLLWMLFIGVDNPKICPFPLGEWGPYLIHGSLGPSKSAPKRYRDRFSRFSQGSRTWPTDTDTQTDRPSYSMCSKRQLSLAISEMWPITNLNFIWLQRNNKCWTFQMNAICHSENTEPSPTNW